MPLLTLLGQTSASKTVGGTSQLSGFGSSGGVNVFSTITVGGTDQLAALSSSGGISVIATHTLGGTVQLATFTSTGEINAGTGTTTKGGYVPPIYKNTKLKKKDESIRDEINALLTEVKETTAFVPLKVETGLREVYDKAPEIINLKESTRRTQQLAALSVEVNELRKTLKRTIKEAQEDEETAIQALLEIM